MVTGIIGRKVGMTQIFDPDGTVHPATVIKAGPCVVVQAKTKQTDGYESIQLGFVEETPAKTNKPTTGHFKKANVPATRVQREVGLAKGAAETPKVGDQLRDHPQGGHGEEAQGRAGGEAEEGQEVIGELTNWRIGECKSPIREFAKSLIGRISYAA